jgi:AraC-like DNA-binding protein
MTIAAGPDSRQLPVYGAGSIDVPYVIDGMEETVDRDTRWEAHSHPTHELLWNERGASRLTVGARHWTVTANDGLWVPAGVLHSGWMPAGTRYRTAQFSIHAAPLIAASPVAVSITPLLRLLLDRLELAGLGPEARSTTERMVLDVLEPSARELLLCEPEGALLGPIVRAVREDPADATTLAEWARRLGVSGRTITRAFHAETGQGFSRWIASARAQHAIALLAAGESLDDVSERVGYQSTSAFGTAFRRVTGMSPGRFRSQ